MPTIEECINGQAHVDHNGSNTTRDSTIIGIHVKCFSQKMWGGLHDELIRDPLVCSIQNDALHSQLVKEKTH